MDIRAWILTASVLPAALVGFAVADPPAADQVSPQALLQRARLQAEKRQFDGALADYDRLLAMDPQVVEAWYWRGRARFCAGKVAHAVEDFDRYIKERPELKPRMWERGIALYYAGRFDDGAAQFALYQTYHDNDVENATWRYLCMARSVGVEKARKELLPIRDDRRVPMMQIYALFQGKGNAEQVLEAAQADPADDEQRNHRLFYAHLYLGLYYEAEEKADLARKHIRAARDHKIGHYMWDVANVHAGMLDEGGG